MRATLEEKRTWVRMGWELAVLEQMAIDILCDKGYQAVMSKAALSGISRAVDGINRVRQEADSRSSRRVALIGPDLFYGSGLEPARDMVKGFREKLIAEATANGDRLYNLLKGETDGQ